MFDNLHVFLQLNCFLTNTTSPNHACHHQEYHYTPSCLRSWSTGIRPWNYHLSQHQDVGKNFTKLIAWKWARKKNFPKNQSHVPKLIPWICSAFTGLNNYVEILFDMIWDSVWIYIKFMNLFRIALET